MALAKGDIIIGQAVSRTAEREVRGVVREVYPGWALILLDEFLAFLGEDELVDINTAQHTGKPEWDCGWLDVTQQPGFIKMRELLGQVDFNPAEGFNLPDALWGRVWLVPTDKEKDSGDSLAKGEVKVKKWQDLAHIV